MIGYVGVELDLVLYWVFCCCFDFIEEGFESCLATFGGLVCR